MVDWIAAMEARHSTRRFSAEALTSEQERAMHEAIAAARPLDAGVPVRLDFVPFSLIASRAAVAWIPLSSTAPWYLVASCPPAPRRMEEVGYRMEQVILSATGLGLGTCWVGGLYSRSALGGKLALTPEDIIAISPVGVPERGTMQSVTQAVVKRASRMAGKRKPLEQFCFAEEWDKPLVREQAPPSLWRALELARIAPSWANLQPWYFLYRRGSLWACADARPRQGNDRPGKPYYRLDTGIAMSHVALALAALGEPPCPWGLAAGEALAGLPSYAVPLASLALV